MECCESCYLQFYALVIKRKVLTSSLPPGGGAHSRALKAEKS